MPAPSAIFTEMVTTTLRNSSTDVVDNISKNNALLRTLKSRGHIKTESGGTEITFPIEYAENGTYQRFSGYDLLNTSASDVLTSVKFDWQQIALHVTASGRELKINNGKEAMIKLTKARVKNAKNTASNQMSVDLYSDGALANQIGGLAHLIQSTGAGTVGGINSTTFPIWQNKVHEMVGTNTWSAATIRQEMGKLWLKQVRGDDKPDLLVFSHDIYQAYEDSLQAQQRYQDVSEASSGFESLKYKSASVIFDDNTNFGVASEQGYFLNTKYLYLVQHSEAQWTQDDDKTPINQDAVVIPLYWMGNMVCTNRALQGKLIDAA